jgi:hypothetical protein
LGDVELGLQQVSSDRISNHIIFYGENV